MPDVWLIDENISWRLAEILQLLGRPAVHVRDRLGPSAKDPQVLELAAREFDILLTQDEFRNFESWRAAKRAMLDSLRIVRIRFRSSQRGDRLDQARALLWRLPEIETTLTERPQVRLVTLSGDDFRARFTLAQSLQGMDGPQGVIR